MFFNGVQAYFYGFHSKYLLNYQLILILIRGLIKVNTNCEVACLPVTVIVYGLAVEAFVRLVMGFVFGKDGWI